MAQIIYFDINIPSWSNMRRYNEGTVSITGHDNKKIKFKWLGDDDWGLSTKIYINHSPRTQFRVRLVINNMEVNLQLLEGCSYTDHEYYLMALYGNSVILMTVYNSPIHPSFNGLC